MNRAFLIGINSLGLQYAERDVELMAHALQKWDYAIDKATNEKANIISQLDQFIDDTNKTDVAIMYFSGHGHIVKGQLHLVLGDNLQSQAHLLDLAYLTRSLDKCKARHKLLILDCCHAGVNPEEWRFDITDRYQILTASERLEQASETDDFSASFMTYQLQTGLCTQTEQIANSHTGQLGINDLYQWLKTQTTQYNAEQQATIPIPNLLGNQKNNFPLFKIALNPQQTYETRLLHITQGLATRAKQIKPVFIELTRYLRELKTRPIQPEDENFLILLEDFIQGDLPSDIVSEYWQDMKAIQLKQQQDSQLNYEELGEQLREGDTAVFITSDMTHTLISALVDNDEFDGDFPKTCQFVEYEGGRDSLERKIKQLLPTLEHSGTYVQLCELLGTVKNNLIIISACQDNRLEQTFQTCNKPYIVITPHVETVGRFVLTYSDRDKPDVGMNNDIDCKLLLQDYSIIYKSMGCLHLQSDAEISDLYLSETDYFRYARHINELIPENLIVQLRRKSLWFLGYYPHSWENRLLIRGLLSKCKTERHQTQPIAIDNTTTQFTELYWQSNSVNNHKIALDEFIQNLQQAMLTNTRHA